MPDRFRERQWLRLDGGTPSPDLIAQLQRALSGSPAPAAVENTESRAALTAPRRSAWRIGGVALAAVAVVVLIAAVLRSGHPTAPAPAARPATEAPPAAATAVADRKSIAVLPFDNLSGRAEDNYLADGLQEEILNALARVRELKVISRTSVMEFRGSARNLPEIGRRLGVGSILEGSIRRDGNALRLTVQLIDAHDDRHLLATNYDRELSHILGLQSAVARQVADALAATLTRYERGEFDRVATNSGDAYNRYLRAVALFHRSAPNDDLGLKEPRRLLQEALRFDPDYADALALLSEAETWTYFASRHRDDGVRSQQALERALAIDPQLPEARLARGLYALYVTGDLEQALTDLDAVVRVRPSLARAHAALGFALRRRARWSEALTHLQRAWDLDPLNDVYGMAPLTTLVGLRRYPEAVAQATLYSQRLPNDPQGYLMRARLEAAQQGSSEPLHVLLRDRRPLFDPPDATGVEALTAVIEGRYLDAIRIAETIPVDDPLWRAEVVGFWYLSAGDAARATETFRRAEGHGRQQLKREPENNDVIARLAMVQSMLGEHAAALASIERARILVPEARDAINGPQVSFVRSIILVRAGRQAEAYAEVERLLQVPFGAPPNFDIEHFPMLVVVKDDPHFDALLNHAPRL